MSSFKPNVCADSSRGRLRQSRPSSRQPARSCLLSRDPNHPRTYRRGSEIDEQAGTCSPGGRALGGLSPLIGRSLRPAEPSLAPRRNWHSSPSLQHEHVRPCVDKPPVASPKVPPTRLSRPFRTPRTPRFQSTYLSYSIPSATESTGWYLPHLAGAPSRTRRRHDTTVRSAGAKRQGQPPILWGAPRSLPQVSINTPVFCECPSMGQF